jgi:hypothetical protein
MAVPPVFYPVSVCHDNLIFPLPEWHKPRLLSPDHTLFNPDHSKK